MSTNSADFQREGRLILALAAIKNGQMNSCRTAAAAYNVPYRTLAYRANGRVPRVDSTPNSKKLTSIEEYVLQDCMISADERGL